MEVKKIEYKQVLGGNLPPAKIVLARCGQDAPDMSDDVVVSVQLFLAAMEPSQLDMELRFGSRVELFGSQLNSQWGEYTLSPQAENFRFMARKFSAATWADATAQAERYVQSELAILLAALDARRKALENA